MLILPTVAPCVGAWIETAVLRGLTIPAASRTLRGCVD